MLTTAHPRRAAKIMQDFSSTGSFLIRRIAAAESCARRVNHQAVGRITGLLVLDRGFGRRSQKSFVCWRVRSIENGHPSQSEKTDEFSTLYICVRKGGV